MKLRGCFRKAVLLTLPSVLLMILVLEVGFRVAIPACQVPAALYDPDGRVMKYDVKGRRSGLFTIGPLARQRARWRINNHGWNSEIDYRTPEPGRRPLTAIIGDSYVEGFQADVQDNLASVLRRLTGRQVYAFGASGASLSQYLQMSRYVREAFRPEVLVIVVVPNDFEESLRDYKNDPRFLQLKSVDGGFEEVGPREYVPNRMRRLAGRSALVRYLVYNADLPRRWAALRTPGRFQANVDVDRVNARRTTIEQAVATIVRKIRLENPETRIVLMIDALRRDLYAGRPPGADLAWMYEALERAAAAESCGFLDLTDAFRESFLQDGRPFNTDHDFHWNAHGHRTAAEALARFLEGPEPN